MNIAGVDLCLTLLCMVCVGVGGRGEPPEGEVCVIDPFGGSVHPVAGLDNMHWDHCCVFPWCLLLLKACTHGEKHGHRHVCSVFMAQVCVCM